MWKSVASLLASVGAAKRSARTRAAFYRRYGTAIHFRQIWRPAGFPWTREFSPSGPGPCRIYSFLLIACRNFPGVGNRETGGPEQGAFAAEQQTSTAHHDTSSDVTGAQYARRLWQVLRRSGRARARRPRETIGNISC